MRRAIYEGYQTIYEAIQTYVEDVNPKRREKSQRWVYPTLPTSLDTNYPRVTIKLSSFELTPISAGGVLAYSSSVRKNGFEVKLQYTILLFVNKEVVYPITINGSVINAKNELLCEYLSTNIYTTLFKLIISGYFKNKGFWVLPSSLSYVPTVWEYDTSRIVNELSITLNTYEEVVEEVSDSNIIQTVNYLIQPNV